MKHATSAKFCKVQAKEDSRQDGWILKFLTILNSFRNIMASCIIFY